MRCRVSVWAGVVLAWSLSFPAVAGKVDASQAPVPALTAQANVPANDLPATVAETKSIVPTADDTGDNAAIRPWLALLTAVVLAGAMARRRL